MHKQLILLTDPHETCNDASLEEHTCDYEDVIFAPLVAKKLQDSRQDRDVVLVRGDINRRVVDLNRRPSRLVTEFRWTIREKVFGKIKTIIFDKYPISAGRIIIVLDLHSYPKGSFSKNGKAGTKVVILIDDKKHLRFGDLLALMLNNAGVSAVVLTGKSNDIIDECNEIERHYNLAEHYIYIVPILVEINESDTKSDLNLIMGTFDLWIVRVNDGLIGEMNLDARQVTNSDQF